MPRGPGQLVAPGQASTRVLAPGQAQTQVAATADQMQAALFFQNIMVQCREAGVEPVFNINFNTGTVNTGTVNTGTVNTGNVNNVEGDFHGDVVHGNQTHGFKIAEEYKDMFRDLMERAVEQIHQSRPSTNVQDIAASVEEKLGGMFKNIGSDSPDIQKALLDRLEKVLAQLERQEDPDGPIQQGFASTLKKQLSQRNVATNPDLADAFEAAAGYDSPQREVPPNSGSGNLSPETKLRIAGEAMMDNPRGFLESLFPAATKSMLTRGALDNSKFSSSSICHFQRHNPILLTPHLTFVLASLKWTTSLAC